MRKPKKIRVRAVHRDKPDVRRLSRAIIAMAQAQAEADAARQHNHQDQRPGHEDANDVVDGSTQTVPHGDHGE